MWWYHVKLNLIPPHLSHDISIVMRVRFSPSFKENQKLKSENYE